MSEQIKKYTKRPVTVEAMQFTNETKDLVWRWASEIQMNVHPGREDGEPCLRIPTKEGEMTCSLGDWLIREPFPTEDRKLYPCKPDIFEQTYQPTPEPSEQNDKLTAEEISEQLKQELDEVGLINQPDYSILSDSFWIGFIGEVSKRFAAQQVEHATAELREQLKEAEEDAMHKADKWSEWDKMLCSERHTHKKETAALREELAELRKELEAGSKYKHVAEQVDELRSDLKFNREQREVERIKNESLQREIESLKTQLAEAQRQRDEAIRAIGDALNDLSDDPSRVGVVMMSLADTYSLLSSGETKPANPCIHPEWGTDGGGDYCKKCGHRIHR